MEEQNEERKISRRKVVVGLAAAAGVSAAVAGGAYGITELVKTTDPAQDVPDLRSVYIGEPVPAADPESGLWRRADAQRITLEGQAVSMPLQLEASVKEVTVRSLHDGQTIAFLLEWEDKERHEHTIKSDSFRDACGVMLGAASGQAALWMMGTPAEPVTILHWKADWQKDIDDGFQDLEVAFPNVAFDFYPPLVGITNPKVPDDYPENVRNRLPGWSVGNPISQPEKTSPVEKLRAIGPGTLEHMAAQNAVGKGLWQNDRWKVALGKPMAAVDGDERLLESGASYSLAFTVWSGAANDRGSRKSLTKLGQLLIEQSA